MATTLIHKKSTTGGRVPLASELEAGELALNLVDRKLFTEDDAGNVVRIDSPYISASAPTNNVTGDLWYDTTNSKLKVYNGTSFVALSSTTGTVTSVGIAEGKLIDVSDSPVTSSGNITIDVDLEELPDMSGTAAVGDDEFVILDNSVSSGSALRQKRKPASEIDLSIFSNSTSGFLSAETDTLATVTGRTNGNTTTKSITVGGNANETQLKVKGNASQTANMVEVLNSSGSALFTIDKDGDIVIAGDLTVSGGTTTVSSNEVNIGDSIILLNSDETGSPSQDAGIEIERGTAANVSFFWDESAGKWDLGGKTLQNVVLDGGAYTGS